MFGEKLYLSPILDLCSSDLVSYTISDRPALSMVTTMLDEAFAKIPAETNLILHSDQGWQYQHKQYQQMLREKGVRQSMSRKGNCLDNAVIENFFGLLKSELLYLQEFRSMEHFKLELIEYLDYYNNRRIKAKLKGLPPAIPDSKPFRLLEQFYFRILSNFLGSLHIGGAGGFFAYGFFCCALRLKPCSRLSSEESHHNLLAGADTQGHSAVLQARKQTTAAAGQIPGGNLGVAPGYHDGAVLHFTV